MTDEQKKESFFRTGDRVKSLMNGHIEGEVLIVHNVFDNGWEYLIGWDNGMCGSFTEQQIIANGIKKCKR